MIDLEKALADGYGDPRFYKLLEDMAILHSQKNKDYAQGGVQGHLGNFERVSSIKRLYPKFDWTSPFGTAMDYMLKQMDAAFIMYAENRPSTTGEDVPKRLRDVGVYSGIGSLLWVDEMFPPETEQLRPDVPIELKPGMTYPMAGKSETTYHPRPGPLKD